MLDPKLLRNQLDEVARELEKRGYFLPISEIKKLEKDRKTYQTRTQELQSKRNTLSKQIGQAKAKGEEPTEILLEMEKIKSELTQLEDQLDRCQADLKTLSLDIPNVLHEDVPVGADETQNKEAWQWGQPREFTYEPLDHVAIGEQLMQMDFSGAAKLSGSRFVVLQGQLARLHRALAQFMLDMHTQEHGYTETYVPFLVKPECLYGTGQLPKFKDEHFFTEGEQGFSLIPTAEVPLTNLAKDEIIADENLPLKRVAHTPCFRSEAGSYGKDTRGLIRQHQFEKVELVQLVRPEDSYQALEELTGHAEAVLQALKLPYRVMLLCSGDTGFSAAKTYDLEVWLPSQNQYREISSCSNFESFQARRLHARWRNPETGKPELLHTLNGSGLAVGRTLVAIMENYQLESGGFEIPECLRSYMGGQENIQGEGNGR